MVPELQIVAAVTKENEKTDWAKSIKKAYHQKNFVHISIVIIKIITGSYLTFLKLRIAVNKDITY